MVIVLTHHPASVLSVNRCLVYHWFFQSSQCSPERLFLLVIWPKKDVFLIVVYSLNLSLALLYNQSTVFEVSLGVYRCLLSLAMWYDQSTVFGVSLVVYRCLLSLALWYNQRTMFIALLSLHIVFNFRLLCPCDRCWWGTFDGKINGGFEIMPSIPQTSCGEFLMARWMWIWENAKYITDQGWGTFDGKISVGFEKMLFIPQTRGGEPFFCQSQLLYSIHNSSVIKKCLLKN